MTFICKWPRVCNLRRYMPSSYDDFFSPFFSDFLWYFQFFFSISFFKTFFSVAVGVAKSIQKEKVDAIQQCLLPMGLKMLSNKLVSPVYSIDFVCVFIFSNMRPNFFPLYMNTYIVLFACKVFLLFSPLSPATNVLLSHFFPLIRSLLIVVI